MKRLVHISLRLKRIKCTAQPLAAIFLDGDQIKATWWRLTQAHQIVPGGKNKAPLLDGANAGCCTAITAVQTFSDLYKHGCAVAVTHDQVNFTATAPGRPIIALDQTQPCLLEVKQCFIFGTIARLFGTGGCCPSP